MTPALLRPLAEADLIARTRFYRTEGGEGLAHRFFDAAVAALDAIARMPGAGSPRFGELCGMPGLPVRRVVGFPCGWFYLSAADHVDVIRLLGDAQDLPAILGEIGQDPPATQSR